MVRSSLDPRIVKVNLFIEGKKYSYENLAIRAVGYKISNPTMQTATITIANLNREHREFILKETIPRNRSTSQLIGISLEVGRESTGASLFYVGDIYRVQPSQPPDVTLKMVCIARQSLKGKLISSSQNKSTYLSVIAKQVADELEADLVFRIPDRLIGSYQFVGNAVDQVRKLESLAESSVYYDNNALYVLPIDGLGETFDNPIEINQETGLVGVPEITEYGVKVTMLYVPTIILSSRVALTSQIAPVSNGKYIVTSIRYNITNRDTPFYLYPRLSWWQGEP